MFRSDVDTALNCLELKNTLMSLSESGCNKNLHFEMYFKIMLI